ncbi:MAG: hypothetical protein KDJ29_07905 [Hyphomicrobiales bacterium]|nr:hypothetical protein [Hyphomicrobiales bacterium]
MRRVNILALTIAAGLALGGAAVAQPYGMMGPGMMGNPGYGMMPGYGMGPGMMGHPGYGMMSGYGPGYGMGPGMMYGYGPRYGMGPGMMYGGQNQRWANTNRNLSVDDVKRNIERWLAYGGNDRLKLGEVKQKDDNTIEATVVTKKENALVQKFEVDRRSGFTRRIGG